MIKFTVQWNADNLTLDRAQMYRYILPETTCRSRLENTMNRCTRLKWWSMLIAILGLAASSAASVAYAQAFPNRNIHIIIPGAPGGPAGTAVRVIADSMQKQLRQNIVVEFRPGGDGVIGTRHVLTSAPDGYTLLYISGFNVTGPLMRKDGSWDDVRDFEPIGLAGWTHCIFVSHKAVPARSLKEFISYAKAHKGELNYAQPGSGTSSHLGIEMLAKSAGIQLVPIAYATNPLTVPDLVSGRVQFGCLPEALAEPHVKSGQLVALASSGTVRSQKFPDVPTATEAGFPSVVSLLWTGLAAPNGTPATVTATLSDALRNAVLSPEVQVILKRLQLVPMPTTREDAGAYVATERKRWAELISAQRIEAKR